MQTNVCQDLDMTTTPTTKTRFVPGDTVIWNGHTATVAAVDTSGASPRYSIFTTDGSGITELDLLGRVLSAVRA